VPASVPPKDQVAIAWADKDTGVKTANKVIINMVLKRIEAVSGMLFFINSRLEYQYYSTRMPLYKILIFNNLLLNIGV
jgi:hypothetical protein